MPLGCFICEVDREYISFQDCLNCADQRFLHIDQSGKARHCQYPRAYIAACTPDNSREHAGISSTMVSSDCARKTALEMHEDYAELPSKLQPSVKGTAQHEYFEKFVQGGAMPESEAMTRFRKYGVLAEVRLAIRMPSGQILTGKMDTYLADHHRLEDYKFKSEDKTPFTKAPPGYVVQLNIYRYMLEKGCFINDTGEIVPPQEPITELVLYPSNHKDWFEVYCPVWPLERVERFIETKLAVFSEMTVDTARFAPRGFKDPATHPLCKGYCAFKDICVATGGEYRDFFSEAVAET